MDKRTADGDCFDSLFGRGSYAAAPMSLPFHIIVTCTKQKTLEIPDALRLRNLRAKTLAKRARRWIERLEKTAAPQVPAEQLYCGDHWQLAKQLRTLAARKGFEPALWVISTGYGLIPAEAPIKPYMATFSTSHDDTICVNTSDGESFSQWWQLLARWGGPVAGAPRTLADLTVREPHANVLLVSSEAYLDAVREDLVAAGSQLKSREQLLIVSAGTKNLGELTSSLVPLDARAQDALGGARRTLNVRMARWILQNAKPNEKLTASSVHLRCRKWLERQPKIQSFNRRRSTDDMVRKFLSAELSRNPDASFSPLLTRYRARNWACEQFRFRELFRDVRRQVHG